MKKIVRVVLAIVFVFGIILASAPQYALAKTDPESTATPKPLIAAGAWTSGSAVDVSGLVGSAPTWLQWLANGVKVTEAGKICHPMRGGQFGWVGQIMQYKNGEWIKLTTTNDWVPNKEGEFMSCAQAPAAGTYALFGYWIRPASYVEGTASACNYSTTDWSADRSNLLENPLSDIDISGLQSGLNGLTLTLTVDADPLNMLADSTYTTQIVGGTAKFSEILDFKFGDLVNFTISVNGCSKPLSLGIVD